MYDRGRYSTQDLLLKEFFLEEFRTSEKLMYQ